MPYRRLRLPSATKEFKWFCETYGHDACDTATQWVDALVAASARGKQLASIKLDVLLEELLSEEVPTDTDWKYVMEQFKAASAKEKVLALLLFAKGQVPWKQLVAMREIICLGHVPVELYAYYQVNRPQKTVVFTKFDYCGVEKVNHVE